MDQGTPAPEDDGLCIREIGEWTKDKLEIVRHYLAAFGKVIYGKSPFYFVDGFAGPGINRLRGTDELMWGSPLLGLKSSPPFSRSVLVELGKAEHEALAARAAPFGRQASVVPGDVNKDILPAMKDHLSRSAPTICLLDPEGSELDWTTVVDVSRFRTSARKAEQLILLPTDTGFMRALSVKKPPPWWSADMMNRIFGNDSWRSIYERRLNEIITPGEARQEYVDLYRSSLRHELKYKYTLARPIRARGFAGSLKYYLIFATDDEVGNRIMTHIFERVVVERRAPDPEPEPEIQGSLF